MDTTTVTPPQLSEADLTAAQERGHPVRVFADFWGDVVQGLAEVGASGRRSHSGVEILSGEVRVDANRDLYPREWRGENNEPGVVDAMLLDPIGASIGNEYRDNLRPAIPRIQSPPDATDDELADAGYVETVLYKAMPAGGWDAFWEEVIEAPARGLALFERTFPFDRALGANVVRLDPILAWSIDNWIHDSDGWGISQYRSSSDEQRQAKRTGSGRGPRLESRRLLAVRYGWQNRGGNPEPYGIMRAGYRSWKSRRLLHLLLMNGSERAAYGIPYVEIDPEVAQKGDLAIVNSMMRNWRANLRGFGNFPPGYKPGVLTIPFDAAKITALYERMGIEWFQACGTPHLRLGDGAGAFNLHQSMGSAFGRRLQGISAMFAKVVEREIVRPLIKLRRGAVDRYPVVLPGEALIGSPIELVSATTAAVQAGLVTDRDGEVEDRARALLLLPERPEDDGPDPEAEEAEADDAPETPDDDDQAEDPGEDTEDTDTMAAGERLDTVGILRAFPDASIPVSFALAARYDGRLDAFGRLNSGPNGRPLRAAERVVRLAETRGRTEDASNAVAAAIAEWRERVASSYPSMLAKAGGFDAMRAVPVPFQAELVEELIAIYRQVYEAGISSVKAEADRMERRPGLRAEAEAGALERTERPHTLSGCHCGAVHLADQVEAPKAAPGAPADAIDKANPETAIRTTARTTADAEAAKVRTAALDALQSAGRGGFPPETEEAVEAVARQTIRQLSLPLARVAGQKDANTIFGLARQQAQRAQGSELFLYSNLLESDVCENCEAFDGNTFGADELADYATPAVWCLGGDRCNCLIIAIR